MVVQPISWIAEVAADLLLERMAKNGPDRPKTIVLPTELILGESVGTVW